MYTYVDDMYIYKGIKYSLLIHQKYKQFAYLTLFLFQCSSLEFVT